MASPRVVGVVLGVIALHVGWLSLIVGSGSWRSPRDELPRTAPMAVRMVAPTAPPQAEPVVPEAPPSESAETLRVRQPSRVRASSATTRIDATLAKPDTAGDTNAPVAGLAVAPAGASASAVVRALDLALPRWSGRANEARSPVLDDPRARTARTTAEERWARSFDTRVIEEPLGDGRVRIRQGDRCVISAPSRASQMFAADGSGGPAPRQVSPCP